MRWLFTALVVLLVAVGSALLLHRYPGAVTIEIGAWIVETTVAVGVAGLILAFVAAYLLLRLIGMVLRTPGAWQQGLAARRTDKARRSLVRGLIEMAEGRWESAEKLLVRHADRSETSLLNYLAAARAAQQVGAYERRDRYLKAAIEANPEADIAVSLTQAELQLAHHQAEHALATLTRLRSLAPQHTYVMKLLSRLYLELEDWDSLAELLPDLRRRKVLVGERLRAIERSTALGQLGSVPAESDRLTAIWDALPRPMKDDATVLHVLTRRLVEAGADAQAEKRLRQYLNRHWNETLVREHGLTRCDDVSRQLDHAEDWLRDHGRSPMLLLTLGRLCMRNRLWGKARAYFESSLEIEPQAETYHELALLLDHLGESGAAREHYRNGLALAVETRDELGRRTAARQATRRAAAAVRPVPQIEAGRVD